MDLGGNGGSSGDIWEAKLFKIITQSWRFFVRKGWETI